MKNKISEETDEIEDDAYDEIEEFDEEDIEEFEPSDEPDEFDAEIERRFEPLDENEDPVKELPQDSSLEMVEQLRLAKIEEKNNKEKKESKVENYNELEILKLDESEELAEMISIILGDGNINLEKNRLRVSSNRSEEKMYREYTKDLMHKLFKIEPKSQNRKGKNAVDLVINDKAVVTSLINNGLKSGNKVKNQVKVPDWIKQKFKISSLRGLFDTDGSIYLRNTQKSIGLNFKNGSLPLVKDFKDMCESLGLKTQKLPKPKISQDPKTGKIYKIHQLTIEDKFYVSKFIHKIKPKKWDDHSKVIGMALITFEYPEKRTIIKKTLDQEYPDKKIHYNKKYENLLRNLCEEQGFLVNKRTIIHAIKKALADKRNRQDTLNPYAKKIIDGLEQRMKLS